MAVSRISKNRQVNYRPYHPDDFAQLYAIEETCFQPPIRFSRRYMREIISHRNSATWIAEESGRLAGFAIVDLTPETESTFAYVQTIEVAPAYRKQGIGAELLRRVEDSARAAAATVIRLHVDTQNDAAIRLYRAYGYRRVGRQNHYYAQGRAAEIYVKSLQAHPLE
jgi:ribosomal protein S18 acetylase RimI-like enzyme